jgi:hypothetical protein
MVTYIHVIRETASQLQHFLGLNKDPDIFLRKCLEAVHDESECDRLVIVGSQLLKH